MSYARTLQGMGKSLGTGTEAGSAAASSTGLSSGTGGMDFGSIAAALLPMLLQSQDQSSSTPQQSSVGGSDSPVQQVQMPQFNRPPSTGKLIAEMLSKQRGGY